MSTTARPRCLACDAELPLLARRHARTCGPRCRQALSRVHRRDQAARIAAEAAARIPAELTSRARWVRHAAKRPMRIDGKWASTTDPSTWSDYASAQAATTGDGIGYVLTAGDRVVVVDLDHAVEDGVVRPWAQCIVDALPATYMERGRSGTGLHLWFRGFVPAGRRIRKAELAVEVYSDGRYIIVGDWVFGTPLSLAELPDAAGAIASLT